MFSVQTLFLLCVVCFIAAFVVVAVDHNTRRALQEKMAAHLDNVLKRSKEFRESTKVKILDRAELARRQNEQTEAHKVSDVEYVTSWFKPDTKPVHVGNYEINVYSNRNMVALWDGEFWCNIVTGKQFNEQSFIWRGQWVDGASQPAEQDPEYADAYMNSLKAKQTRDNYNGWLNNHDEMPLEQLGGNNMKQVVRDLNKALKQL